MLLISFCILLYLILRKKQDHKQNWAIFFSVLFSFSSIQLVNYICENQGFWEFTNSKFNVFVIPPTTLFTWTIIWGIIPLLSMNYRTTLITFLMLFWIDVLSMPYMADDIGFHLSNQWMLGNVLMCLMIFIPGYCWAYFFYYSTNTSFRAVMQVLTMILLFFYSLPILLYELGTIKHLNFSLSSLEYQVLFIFAFPGLVATQQLVSLGKGTPFPYDKTKKLVQIGIYSYSRNPIQWSFSIIWIPLAWIHSCPELLIACPISFLYSISVSNFQESFDMKDRFRNDWDNYIKKVPKWHFIYVPKYIPQGKIYFDFNCKGCTEIKDWFSARKAINLEIIPASEYNGEIKNVTYVDYLGNHHRSIEAIAFALGHINLFYACAGWFMNFPIIKNLLQVIVDSIELEKIECELES